MRVLHFFHRHKGLHDERFQFQFSPQFTDHLEHLLTLALVELLDVYHLLLRLLAFVPQLLELGRQLCDLFLLRMALRLQLFVLMPLLILALPQERLLLLLLLELPLLPLQLLLLHDGLLHHLLPHHHLLLHAPELVLELRLAPLLQHRGLLLLVDLRGELVPLALGQVAARRELPPLRLRLHLELVVLLPQLGLHGRDVLGPQALLHDDLPLDGLLHDLLDVLDLLLDARRQGRRGGGLRLRLLVLLLLGALPEV
mmetsp:Transcript_98013/g.238488  ORF Transcript_98013/g.238488 Transcript_98013/m.238488 type:complete len:255 (-) Transcript_98013:13-777(-)